MVDQSTIIEYPRKFLYVLDTEIQFWLDIPPYSEIKVYPPVKHFLVSRVVWSSEEELEENRWA